MPAFAAVSVDPETGIPGETLLTENGNAEATDETGGASDTARGLEANGDSDGALEVDSNLETTDNTGSTTETDSGTQSTDPITSPSDLTGGTETTNDEGSLSDTPSGTGNELTSSTETTDGEGSLSNTPSGTDNELTSNTETTDSLDSAANDVSILSAPGIYLVEGIPIPTAFDSLFDAVEACKTNGNGAYTITLLGNDPNSGTTPVIPDGINITLTSVSTGDPENPYYTITQLNGWHIMLGDDNVVTGGTLTIKNIILQGDTGNTSTSDAGIGGIRVTGASAALTIETDATIQYCSGKDGAAVFTNGGTVTLDGGSIVNNTASSDGGAIRGTDYYGNPANIIINSGLIGNNRGQYGGAIAVNNATTITMNGGAISNNTATGTGRGGGINLDIGQSSTPASFTMNGGEISSNTAVIGGGILSGESSVTINSGTFKDNTATFKGGGINTDRGTLTISPTTENDVINFIGNTATVDGGGIYESSTFTISEIGGALNFSGNVAGEARGGGLYTSNNNLTIPLGAGSISFADNTAHSDGAGIFAPGSLAITSTTGNISFTGNESITAVGSGIYATSSLSITSTSGDINFTGNTSNQQGGSVYAGNGLTITSESGLINFSQNTSTEHSGGAIYVAGGNTTITGGTQTAVFTQNSAMDETSGNGGAIFIAGGGTVALTNVSITHNQAHGDGGGFRGSDTPVTLRNTDISYNAGQYGAGISVNGGNGSIDMDSTVTITHNTGATHGGGVNIDHSTLVMNGGTISNNGANKGGGIFMSGNATMQVTSGSITNNTAESGGGVFQNNTGINFSLIPASTTSTITVKDNTATGDGGGIYSSATTVIDNAAGGQIIYTDNTAAGDGGGMIISGGSVTLNNFTMSANEAEKDGGAIRATSGASLALTNMTISDNHAAYGGGISANSSSTLTTDAACVITANTAIRRGGGVNIDDGTTYTMNGATITGNSAATGGGVIASKNATVNMNSGTITGNTSTGSGGGIRMENSDLIMSGGSVFDNHAGGAGGGVYLTKASNTAPTATLTMSGSATITGNTAGGDGGGIYTEDLSYTKPLAKGYQNIHIPSVSMVTGNVASSLQENPTSGVAIDFDWSLLNNYQINYYPTETYLKYDANTANYGAAGGENPATLYYGIGEITLASPSDLSFSPSQANYAFKEWNTEPDGTGVGYAAGATITITAVVDDPNASSTSDTILGGETLYAIWRTPAILLSGHVFLDTASNNRQYDTGEGLEGITVTLYALEDGTYTPSGTYDTNGDGLYEFGLMPNKTYKISVPLLANSGGVDVGESGFIIKGDNGNELASHVYQPTGLSDEIVIGAETELWVSITKNAGYAPPFPVDTGIHFDQAVWVVLVLASVGGIVGLFVLSWLKRRKRSRWRCRF